MSAVAGFWNKDPHDVILQPVASEKAARLEDEGKYTFIVDPRANKTEIKQELESDTISKLMDELHNEK